MAKSITVSRSKKNITSKSPITKREVKKSTQKAIAKYGKILRELANR